MQINEDDPIVRAIRAADVEARERPVQVRGARKLELILRRVMEARETEPLDVVGVTEAAELLGVAKPRIYRYQEQGRMPEAVRPNAVDDQLAGGQLFRRAEVVRFAEELRAERGERERKRVERQQQLADRAKRKRKREMAKA